MQSTRQTRRAHWVLGTLALALHCSVSAAGPGPSVVSVNGRQLLVERRRTDGTLEPRTAYIMRGVNWSPASTNTSTTTTDPNNTSVRRKEFGKWHSTDLPLIKGMNANTVRLPMDLGLGATEGPVGMAVLDACFTNGIMVIMTADDGINNTNRLRQAVSFYREHPAILMWSLGNEWNINRYYGVATSVADAARRTEAAAALVKALDANHPVASSYGDIDIDDQGRRLADTASYVNTICPHVDVWSLNIYRGKSFGLLFSQWTSITAKPMFLGEFGIDAFRSTARTNPNPPGALDEATQAEWDVAMWDRLAANLSARDPARAAIGGAVHEFCDEWWKIQPATSQQSGGWLSAAFPDGMASEEFFGLCNIHRSPRQAYHALRAAFDPNYTPSPSKTWVVANTNDAGSGSLRQALSDAIDGDTIAFAAGIAGVIAVKTELLVNKDLTIIGPDGPGLTLSGSQTTRVFTISNAVVRMSRLRLADGRVPDFGGAIRNFGSLELDGCEIANNFAGTLGDGRGQGGGIYTDGPLTLNRCTFISNTSTGNGGAVRSAASLSVTGSVFGNNRANYFGGALFNFRSAQVKSSSFSGNTAATGGAIWNENGLLFICESTLDGNRAVTGGGLANKNGDVTVCNSTLSGNSAANGGGIYNGVFDETGGTLEITGCTIASNRVTSSSGQGGGVRVATGNVTFGNTLLARNSVPPAAIGPDCSGVVNSAGHNLIGDSSGCTGIVVGVNGDQAGNAAAPIDPRLAPLADNGGPTRTHALIASSPALDQGKSFGLPTDQRGEPRPSDHPNTPNAAGGDGTDIGAVEMSTRPWGRIRNLDPSRFRITFSGIPGQTYQIQSADAFNNANVLWTTLAAGVADLQGVFEFDDLPGVTSRFYRAISP